MRTLRAREVKGHVVGCRAEMSLEAPETGACPSSRLAAAGHLFLFLDPSVNSLFGPCGRGERDGLELGSCTVPWIF